MSKIKVEEVLAKRLRLDDAQFLLRRIGTKISGSIVSNRFRNKSDKQRQRMIWEALEKEFGPKSSHYVGTILAYTEDEWNIDLGADDLN